MFISPRRLLIAALFITGLISPFFIKAEQKSLQRFDDPVVMDSSGFGLLFGSPMKHLALMALNGDDWSPVPFQIDEKNPDGDFCFTMGPDASRDPDPNLDANDEIVFMAKDTGDSVEDGVWPKDAKQGVEIEVIDPKSGQKGWVYLFRFNSKAPRSKEDYIRVEIDEANQYRQVVTYEFVMGGPMDRIYPNYLAARELADGSPGKDVLDMLKMRGQAVLPWGVSIPYYFDNIVRAEDKGWIDGPVRVLHLADGYLEFTSFIKIKGSGYSLISYYVNHMIWPMVMNVPTDWMPFVQRLDFHGFMDFNENVYGSCSFSAANPYNKDVIFDGRMSEAEKNMDTQTPIDWIAGYGPQGAMVSRLIFVPEGRTLKLPYYLDDETVNDPPENNPGVSGVGYNLVQMERNEELTASTAYQYYYYLGQMVPEDVHRILDILDHPLEVKPKEIELLNQDKAPGK